ncbi:helix-turn-helix domain-containing protein [Salmonella enterica subsp. enterica serovar Agona]|nr:helix-turn-helix domain-containing protein [Salmonella enterica subsp. enterica serovar Agona]EJM2547475.1 helix-turn-helix domain-containing protein [Salmonella enterica]EIW2451555.1 helix-turn-helix domain-containing protein [Salmonella enterica subsp. enterica serovar Agona]EJQ6084064.1 helix-turn-helix domain-containing protein [Salmonella enterica subsp. enterica serovar Agona]EKD7203471.1 helix-turn-helix domain-containing protein [Salmonella enterica subsp. enterica serovar Agona]
MEPNGIRELLPTASSAGGNSQKWWRPRPKDERLIAEALGVAPEKIWPSGYS